MHTPHGASNNTVAKFRIIMFFPPAAHKVLHFSSIKSWEIFKIGVTFFCFKIPMLSSCFVQSPPDFFYAPDICTFYALYSTVAPIMDVPLSTVEGQHTNRSFSVLVYDGYKVTIFSLTKNFRLSIQPDFSIEMVPLEKGSSNERFEKVFRVVPFQC